MKTFRKNSRHIPNSIESESQENKNSSNPKIWLERHERQSCRDENCLSEGTECVTPSQAHSPKRGIFMTTNNPQKPYVALTCHKTKHENTSKDPGDSFLF